MESMKRGAAFFLLTLGWVVASQPLPGQTPIGQIGQGASPTPAFHVTDASNGRNVCPHENPPFLHWALRQFDDCEIEFEVNGDIPGGIAPVPSAADATAAVLRAAATWTALNPALISLKDVSDTTDPCPQAPTIDGRNCIFWDPNFPSVTKPARTHIHILGNITTTGKMVEVDIQLNPTPVDPMLNQVAWAASPNCPGAPAYPMGIENVLLHELGHFLGLDHPDQSQSAQCPKHDANNTTVMFSKYTDACELSLSQADKDGGNFLYSADLGDAADPPYPTKVHGAGNNGPEHLFGIHTDPDPAVAAPRYQYEWLGLGGGIIDDNPAECEALIPDNDLDDGVEIHGECDEGHLEPDVTVKIGVKTAADVLGKRHDYSTKPMYLNGWIDWNDDGTFGGGNEYVIGSTPGGVSVTAAGSYSYNLTAPPDTPCDIKSRFRLDWGEDVGQMSQVDTTLQLEKGAAQFGEVEDYVGLTHDSGGPGGGDPPLYCHQVSVEITTGVTVVVQLDEPCHEPQDAVTTAAATASNFPAAGSECFDNTATTGLDFDGDGVVDEEIGLFGAACVTRSAPYVDADGLNTIDTEMTVFELTGMSPTLGPITLREISGEPILGQIKQSQEAADAGYDVGPEFPATSYFDIMFIVEGDFGESDPVGPVHVTSELIAVPPVPEDREPPDIRPIETEPVGTLEGD